MRAQSIHVDLLRADAVATNAFLIGGLETPDVAHPLPRTPCHASPPASPQAAAAQPADGTALGALSQQVQTYAALVEQARTNNRLGLPVGAQYLTQASAGLRADAIPIIDAVVEANEERAQDEFDRSNSSLQLAIGLVALIGLVAIAVWLAKRTHRYLNGRLTAAIALLLVALVFTLVAGRAASARPPGPSPTGRSARRSRWPRRPTAANDARANESLTLIRRGSGAANEDVVEGRRHRPCATPSPASTTPPLADKWSDYKARARAGARPRRQRPVGQGGRDVDGRRGEGLRRHLHDLRRRRDAGARRGRQGCGRAPPGPRAARAPVAALGVALAALLAAWLVVRGIGQRIEEYR